MFTFGVLPQVVTAGAGTAGGVILIGGAPVTITITVTGAVVLGGVALWQTGVLQEWFQKASDWLSRLDGRCAQVKADCISSCSDTALPTRDFGIGFWSCVNACLAKEGCI